MQISFFVKNGAGKFLRAVVALAVTLSMSLPATNVFAQDPLVMSLPKPGSMVNLSKPFTPALIKGLVVHPENPLLFDFIVDGGDVKQTESSFRAESLNLIKYFFAALTIPREHLWVNLSPFEGDRIMDEDFGKTELGRDLLGQDYILKQLTSTLVHPESQLGQAFWSRVYDRAKKEFGVTDVPVNTFNKVWILMDRADIYEEGNTAIILNGHMKVMLEEDYLAMQQGGKNSPPPVGGARGGVESKNVIASEAKQSNAIGSQIIRDILIPEIEKEVNTGANFAPLRQMFYSVVMALWYKKALKEALLNQVYTDKGKVAGVDVADKTVKQQIYQKYEEAFKKGAFNFIKEEMDEITQEPVARKYFAGGAAVREGLGEDVKTDADAARAAGKVVEGLEANGGPVTVVVDEKKDEGKAIAIIGGEAVALSADQHSQINEVIRAYFASSESKATFQHSRPGLPTVNVYVLPQLSAFDEYLVAHPGHGGVTDGSRNNIYLSPKNWAMIQELSAQAKVQFWAHELYHLDNPKALEAEARERAKIDLVLKEINAKTAPETPKKPFSAFHETRAKEVVAYADANKGEVPVPIEAIERMFRVADIKLKLPALNDQDKAQRLERLAPFLLKLKAAGGKIAAGILAAGASSRMAKDKLPDMMVQAIQDDPNQFVDTSKFTDADKKRIAEEFGGDFVSYIKALNPNVDADQEVLNNVLHTAKALLPVDKVDGKWYNFLSYALINIERANDELEALGYGRLFVCPVMVNDNYYDAILKNLIDNNFYGLKVATHVVDGKLDIDHDNPNNELVIYNQGLGYRSVAPASTVNARWAIDKGLLDKAAALEQTDSKQAKDLRDAAQFKSEQQYKEALAFSEERQGQVLYEDRSAEGHGEKFPSLLETTTRGRKVPAIFDMMQKKVVIDYFHNIDNMAMVNGDFLVILEHMLGNKLGMILEGSLRPATERGGGGGFNYTKRPSGKEVVRQTEDTITKASLGNDVQGNLRSPRYDQAAEEKKATIMVPLRENVSIPNQVPVNNASEMYVFPNTLGFSNAPDIYTANLPTEALKAEFKEVLDQALASGNFNVDLKKFADAFRSNLGLLATAKIAKGPDGKFRMLIVNETMAWNSQQGYLDNGQMDVVLTQSLVDDMERGTNPEDTRFNPAKDRGVYNNVNAVRTRKAQLNRVVNGGFFKGLPKAASVPAAAPTAPATITPETIERSRPASVSDLSGTALGNRVEVYPSAEQVAYRTADEVVDLIAFRQMTSTVGIRETAIFVDASAGSVFIDAFLSLASNRGIKFDNVKIFTNNDAFRERFPQAIDVEGEELEGLRRLHESGGRIDIAVTGLNNSNEDYSMERVRRLEANIGLAERVFVPLTAQEGRLKSSSGEIPFKDHPDTTFVLTEDAAVGLKGEKGNPISYDERMGKVAKVQEFIPSINILPVQNQPGILSADLVRTNGWDLAHVDEEWKKLRASGNSTIFRSPYRLYDFKSSFDLGAFVTELTPPGATRFGMFPSVGVTSTNYKVDFEVEAIEDKTKIIYSAPSYFPEDIVIDADIALRDGKTLNGQKDSLFYILRNLYGIKGGFKINVKGVNPSNPEDNRIPGQAKVGGSESSNILNLVAFLVGNYLTQAQHSYADINAMAGRLANNEFGDNTGKQGLFAVLGDGSPKIIHYAYGFKGADGQSLLGNTVFLELMHETVAEQAKYKKWVEAHTMAIQSGVTFKDGQKVEGGLPRVATLVNEMWTSVLLKDPSKRHLFFRQMEAGQHLLDAERRMNAAKAIYWNNVYVDIRDEIARYWLSLVIDGLEGRPVPNFVNEWVGWVRNNQKGDGTDPFAKNFKAVWIMYQQHRDAGTLEDLKKISFYTYGEIGTMVKEIRALGGALFVNGAGGPDTPGRAIFPTPEVKRNYKGMPQLTQDRINGVVYGTGEFRGEIPTGIGDKGVEVFTRTPAGQNIPYQLSPGQPALLPDMPPLAIVNIGKRLEAARAPGGISMREGNINVKKKGLGVQMTLDPAMLERFRAGDFDGIVPRIIRTQMNINLLPLLGLGRKEEEEVKA